MEEIIANLGSVWTDLSNIFYLVYDYLFNLVNTLNNVTFTADDMVYQWFGILRYLMGDTVYLIFISLFTIGASFFLYKLFKKLFNFVVSIIPGLSGGAI